MQRDPCAYLNDILEQQRASQADADGVEIIYYH